MSAAGFPHSDILGSRFVCHLPEAYRRLPRPSSAPSAKASTLCPYKLDHKDHSKRCSRPLCSSQATTGHRIRTPAPSPPGGVVRPARHDPQAKTRPPPPTGDDRRVAAPSSQPFGCSLRTQQRAKPTPKHRWTFGLAWTNPLDPFLLAGMCAGGGEGTARTLRTTQWTRASSR